MKRRGAARKKNRQLPLVEGGILTRVPEYLVAVSETVKLNGWAECEGEDKKAGRIFPIWVFYGYENRWTHIEYNSRSKGLSECYRTFLPFCFPLCHLNGIPLVSKGRNGARQMMQGLPGFK